MITSYPHNEPIKLSRDCEAIQIPSGTKIKLPKGLSVRIAQSLGDNYTVTTDEGYIVQIAGKDADAIGKEPPKTQEANQQAPLEQLVLDQLKTCYDPEIPINIVDLGLVYESKVTPLAEAGNRVDVKMTLTAPGCGMGDVLKKDAQTKIERLPGVKEVNVELVWEPAWDQSRMSDAAKLKLGLM
ncbi:MAG: putative Fe-S cluster assembly protein SufT [Omnitrophica bacterium RIFCSPHIGHO2_02_FULL_46_11]|nr:MAG: putative Fe-S cluster assembly protein SufT [Omnitrophica bacterium RIFCSPHIGHO2_02_FULL_46_11]OGW87277.1 MAG: putative Fe-S cluster assembly protein SufT [Omnitrophica bacterium RIFCSPLOWO2_01_FULL_45_10b]